MKQLTVVISLSVIVASINTAYSATKISAPANQLLADIALAEARDCWFRAGHNWPKTECFEIFVAEDHALPKASRISFPLVIFRSPRESSAGAPVLHLGAGGPGAPMYLDSAETVFSILKTHDEISIDQGRDLYVIDPRGTGLSKPLLSCRHFVDNHPNRFIRNLTIQQEWLEIDHDYRDCVKEFINKGIDLAAYNSNSIAIDIELMRKAFDLEQWVLIGVSYAATYAQIIASRYPSSVEAMILDSANFPRLELHDNFLRRIIGPYQALFNYCDSDPECKLPLENFEQRIWDLYQSLNDRPLKVEISHPYERKQLSFLLNGERFLASILEGIYAVNIYQDLPQIVSDLEKRRDHSIKPYLFDHLAYMLDRTYGDISAEAHYCFEDKPFIDFDLIGRLIDELPPGYIREVTKLWMEWPDFCDEMQISRELATLTKPHQAYITTPTLFLHGEFDRVTPMSDVLDQQRYFDNSQLVSFRRSHSVLTAIDCAESIAASFVGDPSQTVSKLDVCHED